MIHIFYTMLEGVTVNDPLICRCEEVFLSEILNELEKHTKTTKELKLRTRAGMGICQGKTCRPILEKVVSAYTGLQIPSASHLTYKFPARPMTLDELAETITKD